MSCRALLTSLIHFRTTFRLMLCKRVDNEEWGTIDYIDDKLPEENSNRIVFRTRKEVRRRPASLL
jgi:hypothetical protein